MDNEVLIAIKSQLLEVKAIIESAVDELDVETFESPKTGKLIAVDFDETDLTNIQVAADEVVSRLQDLSAEIDSHL